MSLRDRYWMPLSLTTVVASPLLVVIGILVSLSNAGYADPYWLDLSAKATVSVLFLAPGFAALAAWDAARWQTLMSAAVRSWGRLLAQCLVFVAAMSALTFACTLAILYAQVPPSVGWPRLDVLLLGTMAITGYSAVGFVLGRFLSRLVSAPLAFGAVWGWVAYTPAIQPFWLRNVTGNLGTSCCGLDVELVPLALVAPGILTVALVIAAAVLVTWTHRRIAWAGAVVLVAGALFAAASMMAPVGADPVQRRTGEQFCTSSAQREFCAWPEHAAALRQATPDLASTTKRLEAAGLDLPDPLRENTKSAGGWSFSLASGNPQSGGRTLALSPLDELPPPCTDHNGGIWPAGKNFALAGAWLASVGGASEEIAAESHEAPLHRLRRLRERSPDEQLRWYSQVYSAMQTCEPVE